MSPTDVKQTIAISSTDTLQKYIGTVLLILAFQELKPCRHNRVQPMLV